MAEPLTGEVFFRAPGFTGSIYRKQLAYNVLSCTMNEGQIERFPFVSKRWLLRSEIFEKKDYFQRYSSFLVFT